MEEVLVDVGPKGEITISTKGFKGKACLKATETLERALGKKTSDTPTGEAHERERVPARR